MLLSRWPRLGAKITERDGRHVGTIVALTYSQAVVKWDDNGWRSYFDSPADLEPHYGERYD